MIALQDFYENFPMYLSKSNRIRHKTEINKKYSAKSEKKTPPKSSPNKESKFGKDYINA